MKLMKIRDEWGVLLVLLFNFFKNIFDFFKMKRLDGPGQMGNGGGSSSNGKKKKKKRRHR